MRLFIRNIIIGFFLLLSVSAILILDYSFSFKNRLEKRQSVRISSIKYLFIGDSKIQNGIDDALIPNSFNWGNSAESYYYSFAKLKWIHEKSDSLRSVFLGYSYNNLSLDREKIWFRDHENSFQKFGTFYPIIDVVNFLGNGSLNFVDMSIAIITKSIYALEYFLVSRKPLFLGGYTPNNKLLTMERADSDDRADTREVSISDFELYYLEQISNYCNNNAIDLYLIEMPTMSENNYNCVIGTKNYLRISDFVIFNISDFADANHLNPDGAQKVSNFIQNIIHW